MKRRNLDSQLAPGAKFGFVVFRGWGRGLKMDIRVRGVAGGLVNSVHIKCLTRELCRQMYEKVHQVNFI